MSTTLTIGLTLLGFLVGFILAALFSQSRVRSLANAHASRLSTLQNELDARSEELASARNSLEAEQAARQSELETAQNEATDLSAQLNIVRAQLDEFQSEAGEMEDRLNAAEARILSSEAEMTQHRTELGEWSGAYAQLKATHGRLANEHREIQDRRHRLEDELAQRRSEMEELSVRLEALQRTQTLQIEAGADAQPAMAALALARAESEAALHRREAELMDLRSRLSSMRYSVNVLTAAGAELAAQVASQHVIDLHSGEPPSPLPRTHSRPAPLAPAAAQAELADLQGVIADWFADVRDTLPYDAATLRAFGGESAAARAFGGESAAARAFGGESGFAAEPLTLLAGDMAGDITGDMAGDATDAHGAEPAIPYTVMLAAIKAVATARLERSATRQIELARELADHQRSLDTLSERIHAWRTMLYVTLAREPELLALLDEPRATSAGDMLSACATVALTAYQKKQAAQLSAENARAASSAAALPDDPRRIPANTQQPLALREWRPVRRARR